MRTSNHRLFSPPCAGTLFLGVVLFLSLLLLVLEFLPAGAAGPIVDRPVGPQEPVAYRLTENLDRLEVQVLSKERGTLQLKRLGAAFAHPRLPSWSWVGLMQESFKLSNRFQGPRYPLPDRHVAEGVCLWTHPLEEGPLVLRFRDVPLGGRFLGMVYLRTSYDPKASSRYRIRLDGTQLIQRHVQGKPGTIEEVDLMLPGKGFGTLEWEWETVTKGKNHLCLEGVVLAPVEGGGSP